ncbi:MAG: response regulator [Candidatus Pacebacteria bacterium]|nr:response regulator [Candidatus Paceibacterota bacterium]
MEGCQLAHLLLRPAARDLSAWLLSLWHCLFLLMLIRRLLFTRVTPFTHSAHLWAPLLLLTLSLCLLSQSVVFPAVVQGFFLIAVYYLVDAPAPVTEQSQCESERDSPKKASEEKKEPAQIELFEPASIVRRRRRGTPSGEEDRWLDTIDQGYFIVRRNYTTSLVNKKGLEILKEFQVTFAELAVRLVEPEEPRRTLQTFIDGLINEAPEGELAKATLGYVEGLPPTGEAEPSKFKVDLFINYKAYMVRLRDSVLLILREKNQSSNINITDKLRKVTNCTLSHELKTQLNGIIGNLELLEDSVPQETRIHYKVARSSSFILSSRLNDLFDYLQLQSKDLKLHYADIQLFDLLRDIASICESQAEQKGIRFVLTPGKSLPPIIIADRTRIQQVLLNVLSKAIDFTEYGTITLNVYLLKEKHVCFKVVSEGAGMYNHLLANIAQTSPSCRRRKFTSLAEDEATQNIGEMYLEISQMICREMGTKIVVESAENGNSVLRFVVRDGFPHSVSPKLSSSRVQSRRYSIHERKCVRDPQLDRTQYGTDGVLKCQKVENINIFNVNLNSGQSTPILNDTVVKSVISQCLDRQSECGEDVPSESVVDERLLSQHSITPHKMECILSNSLPSSMSIIMPKHCSAFRDPPGSDRPATEEGTTPLQCLHRPRLSKREKVRRTTTVELRNSPFKAFRKAELAEADDSTGILVVDDDSINRFVLKSLLRKFGHNSIEVTNGLQAVKFVEKQIEARKLHELRIIFMDLQMPIMDGIKATRTLIAKCTEAGLCPPPVIGISSDISEGDRRNFFRAGIHEFLNKPIHKDQVIHTLTKYFK